MSIALSPGRLQLPESLRQQLGAFRRRVRRIKVFEAACASAFGVLMAYLLLFAVDRVWDTPGWVRLLLFAAAAIGCARLPYALHRWVWGTRRLEQLARVLTKTRPRIGDRLLGVIELVENEDEQARSRALCEAAVVQVAEDTKGIDLRDAVPRPRHRAWAWRLAVPAAMAVGLLLVVPAAALNSWARLLAPWANVPRYTFAALKPMPETLVVAHGEPFTVTAILSDDTAWTPADGVARLGKQRPVEAKQADGRYAFSFPPQIEPSTLDLRIGDSIRAIRVEPTVRPELASIGAAFDLPEYLERPGTTKKDVRGGAVTLVKGTNAVFSATASRDLASATVDGQAVKPSGATVSSPSTLVDDSRKVEFRWTDTLGLASAEPFVLSVNAREDEAPSVAVDDLPRQRVVLDSETLTFGVRAADDFGVRRVGMVWKGSGDDPLVSTPAEGEQLLAMGGPDKESLDARGTFTAKSLGIEPQAVEVKVYVEDYLPGRDRVYSAPHIFYVLNAEQHAIWVTEQLNKWHRQSLEVRDREMQLFEVNKQLRALSAEELDRPENRRRLEAQSNAERANGRRLTNLVAGGEEMVQQAMRNPEIGVGYLETWAEMLQVLKDISDNRMPSVADLLREAAQSPAGKGQQAKAGPMAGQVRSAPAGGPSDGQDEAKPKPTVPMIVDQESSQDSPKEGDSKPPGNSPPGSPRLTLPQTTLAGKAEAGDQPPPSPAQEKADEAIARQEDLLAEFEKIAAELNRLLANLEGTTLVKRLKAASRQQYKIAGRVVDQIGDTFGQAPRKIGGPPAEVLGEMAEQEYKASEDVSYIMDDLQAYFERRRMVKFREVLDQMVAVDVIGGLRQLGDDVDEESGLSVAQAEFWSDNLDRWAEELVELLPGGT